MNRADEAGDILRGRASQAREKIGGAVQDTREKIEMNAQTHPMRTILISVGAGLLLGMLLGLTNRRRGED
jgi:ElaB/YqjD/DUF883 family membrane-anchored ribosome-binding protein